MNKKFLTVIVIILIIITSVSIALYNIPSENHAPIALADGYSTLEDITLIIDANSGVLANDYDIDGDILTAILDSDVLFGTLTLNANGSFVYVPNADWNGTDSFTYVANDGIDNSNYSSMVSF